MTNNDTALDATPNQTDHPPAGDVHAAICNLIAALPGIGKNETMEGKESYRYRGVETIKALLKEHAPAHGVHWTPWKVRTLSDETYTTGKFDTKMRRVRLRITWRIYGPDGSWVRAESEGEAADVSDKATNKATTAAEKLMLLAVFTIADAADPDHDRPDGPNTSTAVWGTVAQAKQSVVRIVNEADPTLADADAIEVAADVWRRLARNTDRTAVDDVTMREATVWFGEDGGLARVLADESIDARNAAQAAEWDTTPFTDPTTTGETPE